MSLALAGYFPDLPRPVDTRVFPSLDDEIRREAGIGRGTHALTGASARDWSGARVGRLTVIRRATEAESDPLRRPGRYVPAWICRCECGRTAVRLSDTLRKSVREGYEATCRDDGCEYWARVKSRKR